MLNRLWSLGFLILLVFTTSCEATSSPPISTSTAVAQNSDLAATVSAQGTAIAKLQVIVTAMTDEPISTPALTPTPDNSPEAVTARYLKALNNGDVSTVRRLTSQLSLDIAGVSRSEYPVDAGGDVWTYDIGSAVTIIGATDTLYVPVTITSGNSRLHCCVLRKEDDEWRVNGHLKLVGVWTSLVDQRMVSTPAQILPLVSGVTVRPTRIIRLTRGFIVFFAVDNPKSLCVVLGSKGTSMHYEFDVSAQDIKETLTLPGLFSSTSSGEDKFLRSYLVDSSSEIRDYPKSVRLLDVQWGESTSKDCKYRPGGSWNYMFDLTYN